MEAVMLSRNNIHEKLRKMEPQKQRFSIRKFTVGVASVLIGLTFMGINSQTVNAETTDPEKVDATEENSEQVEKSNDQTLSDVKVQNEANASDSKTVEPKNTDSSTETVSADNNKSLKNDQDNQKLTGKSDSQETKNSSERNESEQQNTSAKNVRENDSTPAAEVNKDDSSQRKEEQSPVNSSVKEQQNKDNNSDVAGKNATNIATPKDSNKNIKTDSKKLTPGQVEKSWRVELFAKDENLNNKATTLPVENPKEYPTEYANDNNLNNLTLYDTNNSSTRETVNLKDMYIYQVAQLNDTKQTAILARKSADDDNVYAFIITPIWGSYYKSYEAYRISNSNSNHILDLSNGYKIYYTAPGTMEFNDETIHYSGSTLITGGRYQTLRNEYSLSNVATDSYSASIGEILPTYQGNKDTYSLVKFYDKNGNLVKNDQDAIYVEGWPGQTFTLKNVSQYLKVHKGYYLSNQKEIYDHTDEDGNLTGSISDFEVGGYYRKVYYNNNGKISFIGLYHQISPDGTMAVSLLNANGEQKGDTQYVRAGKSVKFDSDYGYAGYNWTARNPYVTGSVHAIKYVQLGSVVLYDKATGATLKEKQYKNDDSDPASAQLPYSYDKLNDLLKGKGYVLDPEFKESDYELANGQYSQDLRIPYVKQIEVTYSGSDSKTYDGNPAEFNVQSVKWTGGLKTNTLTAGDFDWSTGQAPSDAGSYTLSLNKKGEAALRAANTNYNIQKISGSYSYTIKPAEVKAVTYSGSDSKTYNGEPAAFDVQSVEWTGLTDLNTSTLTAGDFDWSTADKQAPSAAGAYTLSLNETGKAALRAANKNYNIKEISGSYSYTINPAEVKAVTYSGSDSKTYDGEPAEFNVQSVKWTGLTGLNTSTLTADDFDWSTADKKAPSAAGTYTLSLNEKGKAALRAANKNYNIKEISGSYSYTINPVEADKDGHKIPNAPTPQYKNDPTQDTSVTYHPVKKPGNKSHNHSGNKGKISSKTVAHKTQTLTIVATANKSEKAQSNSTAKVEKSTSTNDKETLPQTGEKNENEAGIFGLAIAAISSLFGLAAGKKRRKKEN